METEHCYHMPCFIAHINTLWNLGILAYILKRGTEFATQLEVCLIVIQPLVNGAPHIIRAAIESWAHALTSNCCIFCGIGQWLWQFVVHWLSSDVTPKLQMIMVPNFILFCLILAKHIACPGALRVPRHDKVIFRYSYARFWVFEYPAEKEP